MTPLLWDGSFPAGFTGEAGLALPVTFGGEDKTVFGRSNAALEILTTWALLEGTETTTGSSKTARAMRVRRARLVMSVSRRRG
jgi:hypothetical protein